MHKKNKQIRTIQCCKPQPTLNNPYQLFQPNVIFIFKFFDPTNMCLGFGFVSICAVGSQRRNFFNVRMLDLTVMHLSKYIKTAYGHMNRFNEFRHNPPLFTNLVYLLVSDYNCN